MAGSIALSLTQRYDKSSHEPLDGGLLYFYAAGTTTPQSAYQDISLTIPWPNPITLDSGGNVPQLFFADGYIKFRLANSSGTVQIEADYTLVMGPTAGTGAAPSVDATTILAAGDVKIRYGTGALTGFVRANGRTIGNAASGATERANADTVSLFTVLYADTNLTVSTGRGASAAADYAANKTITLPDFRGRVPAGLNDMGNTDSGILDGAGFTSGDTLTLGSRAGTAIKTLLNANLPAYTPGGTITNGAISFATVITQTIGGGDTQSMVVGNSAGATFRNMTAALLPTQASTTFAGTAQGGTSTPFSVTSPLLLITLYLKL